jgi:hypothetical protein
MDDDKAERLADAVVAALVANGTIKPAHKATPIDAAPTPAFAREIMAMRSALIAEFTCTSSGV